MSKVQKSIRIEEEIVSKLSEKHGTFIKGITIAAEKEVGVYEDVVTIVSPRYSPLVVEGAGKNDILELSEEILQQTPQVDPKECTIEGPKMIKPVTDFYIVPKFDVSEHQVNILSWMFPSVEKNKAKLLNELIDHLIPDTSKTNVHPYDEDGKLLKKFESKTPLPENCAQWKKNLRAMQCVDRMQDLQKVSPPPPSVKRGK